MRSSFWLVWKEKDGKDGRSTCLVTCGGEGCREAMPGCTISEQPPVGLVI